MADQYAFLWCPATGLSNGSGTAISSGLDRTTEQYALVRRQRRTQRTAWTGRQSRQRSVQLLFVIVVLMVAIQPEAYRNVVTLMGAVVLLDGVPV